MLASTWFDPVLGLDTHIVLVPTPAGPVPTPIPMPFVGMVFDPVGAAMGALGGGITLVNGLPATNVGTAVTNKLTMPHIPAPGPFAKGVPGNDAELFLGGLNVSIGGTFGVRLGEIAMSCSDPVRLPTSVVLAIPKGPLVLVMRPPAPDVGVILSSFGMRMGLKLLAKAAKAGKKAFAAFRAAQRKSAAWKSLSSKLRAGAGPGRARAAWNKTVCFLTGHPVDVATGRVITDNVDIELPGPLPLRFERAYDSSLSWRDGPLGRGWSHSFDQAIWGERGRMVYRAGDGREIELSTLHLGDRVIRPGQSIYHPIERLTLRCTRPTTFELEADDGTISTFSPVAGGPPRVAKIVEKRTPDADALRFRYDRRGLLESVESTSTGRALLLEHDAEGRLRRLTASGTGGRSSFVAATYAYDQAGDLIEVRDARGKAWRFEYVTHLLVKETNRNGLSFYFQYDGLGASAKCVRTWGDGGIYDHALTYDSASGRTLVEDSLGQVTLYQIDDAGQVTGVTDALGHTTKYEYHPGTGQKLKEIAPTGTARSWEHDARGSLTKVIGPDGATLSVEYDERGLAVGAVDTLGGRWRWGYDERRHLIGRIDPLGRRTLFEWRGGQLVAVGDPAGQTTRLAYNAAGDLVAMVFPDGTEARWERDAFGRVTATVDPNANVSHREHDVAGRLVRITEADGRVRELEHDDEGNRTRVREGGRDVQLEYRGMGRLAARIEAGTRVEFDYDTEERLVAIRSQLGAAYRFKLGATGYVDEERTFDGGTRRFLRDALGRVTKVARPGGRSADYAYDEAGRVARVSYSDGSSEAFAYRPDGKLVQATTADAAGSVVVSFERDALGRVLKETTRATSAASQADEWVASTYDALGARVRVRSSKGLDLQIRRSAVSDVTGLRASLHAPAEDGEPGQLLALPFETRLERDRLGLEVERTLPGGIHSRWQRDRLGRPLRQEIWNGDSVETARQYTWEPGAQLRMIVDALRGPVRYHHDAVGTLSGATYEDGRVDVRLPDAVGNLFRAQARDDRVYGPSGQVLEARGAEGVCRYEYDAEGSLIRKTMPDGSVWAYHWNGAGMLARVVRPDGTTVRFGYDALGRRLWKEHGGAVQRWIWDGNVPLHEWRERRSMEPAATSEAAPATAGAETTAVARDAQLSPRLAIGPPHDGPDTQGTPEAPITWVFEPDTLAPIAKLVGHRRYGFVVDHAGTPIAMYDDAGRPVWRADLDVHGGVRACDGARHACPFRWPGQYEDAETGLYYNRFRYYDQQADQYLSADPLRATFGLPLHDYVMERSFPELTLEDLHPSASLYGYVPDPTTWIDPFGLVRIHTEGPVAVDAFPGPPAGGIEHLPLHAHVSEGSDKTRVLMEDYYKKGKLVGSRGDVYPGDPAMTKRMKKVIKNNLDDLAAKTRSVFNTGSC